MKAGQQRWFGLIGQILTDHFLLPRTIPPDDHKLTTTA